MSGRALYTVKIDPIDPGLDSRFDWRITVTTATGCLYSDRVSGSRTVADIYAEVMLNNALKIDELRCR